MTREEKVSLLKNISSGKLEAIEQLKKQQQEEEQQGDLYSLEMITAAFRYLANNAPVDAFFIWKNWINHDELDDMLTGIKAELKANRYDLLSDRSVMILGQCMDTIKYFKESDRLHLLTGRTDVLEGLSEEEKFYRNTPAVMFVFNGTTCYVKQTGKFFQSDYFNQYRQSNFGSYHANQHLQVNYKQYVEFFNKTIDWPSQKAAAGL